MRATILLAPLALVAAACSTTVRPEAEISERELQTMQRFGCSAWEEVLSKHVDEDGLVDYRALREDPARLEHFLALLGKVGPRTRPELFPDEAHRLAYYLNAYNAFSMYNVVRREKLEPVSAGKLDFLVLTRFELDGREWNLNDLEKDLILERFDEPRVHFALNGASRGCPDLSREPFFGERLEEQLTRETREFLHDRENVRVEDGTVLLSAIFDWYARDFGGDPLAWIRAAAPELELPPDAEVEHLDYDWSLNVQPRSEG